MKRSESLAAVLSVLVLCLSTGSSVLAAQESRVTGGGTRTIEGHLAHFTVSAIKRSDGSVSGQFQQHDPNTGKLFVHAEVTCLDFINDSTALVSGFITRVNNVPPGSEFIVPGAPFLIYIQDNGEGAGAAPDRVSYYWVGDVGSSWPCGDEAFIAGEVQFYQANPQFLAPIIAGNFQVAR